MENKGDGCGGSRKSSEIRRMIRTGNSRDLWDPLRKVVSRWVAATVTHLLSALILRLPVWRTLLYLISCIERHLQGPFSSSLLALSTLHNLSSPHVCWPVVNVIAAGFPFSFFFV